MKRNWIVFTFLVMIAAIAFTSCTSENPLEPAIRQAWGSYDYFPYKVNMAWVYSVKYPSENLSLSVMYIVSGREYFAPYNGWQISVLIGGVPTYYTVYAETDEAIYNYNPEPEEWLLEYKIPFVIGNKWDYKTVLTNPVNGIEFNVNVHKEVISREVISVTAGDFKNCVKVYEHINFSSTDPIYHDSSYYYIQECWYAPDIGLIKEIIIETNKDYLTDYSCILNQFYENYYQTTSNFQFHTSGKNTCNNAIPILVRNVAH